MTEPTMKQTKSLNYKVLAGIETLEGNAVKAHMRELSKANSGLGTELGSVVGEVTSYEVVEGDKYGAYLAFYGEIVAVSASTGEEICTTKIFFDKGFSQQVRAQFDKREEGQPVRFACRVSVVPTTKSDVGFTYIASPLRTPEVVDRQKALLGILHSATPARLAAPKPAAKKSA